MSAQTLTPEALRNIADWLDTYDRMAIAYIDLLVETGRYTEDDVTAAREAVDSPEIQDDLRSWATELEQE